MTQISNNWYREDDEANVNEILLMEEEQVMEDCDLIDTELAEAYWIDFILSQCTPIRVVR